MNKKVIEMIATAVLVLVLVVVFMSGLGKKKKVPPHVQSAPAFDVGGAATVLPASQAPVVTVFSEAKAKIQKERAAKAWGRDPFLRVKTAEVSSRTSSLELKGISIGADKKGFALINQEIVRIGDKIEGCDVLNIEKNRVLLQKNGQSFYLKLPEEQMDGLAQKGVSR